MKVTEAQGAALQKMEKGRWYSAYELQVSCGTLDALVRKDLVRSLHGLGSMAFPRTSIKYRSVAVMGSEEK